MNIALMMTPKYETIILDPTCTIDQAFDIMAEYRYSTLPLVDSNGNFAGVISEGDLMWNINPVKNSTAENISLLKKLTIESIPRYHQYEELSINADFESLLLLSMNQNFVPITDDLGHFIGIIKRSDIMKYSHQLIIGQYDIDSPVRLVI